VNMYYYRHITSINELDPEKEATDEELMTAYRTSVALVDGLSINIMYRKLIRE